MGKFRWINDDIKIDFPVPLVVTNTMKEAEEADLNNEIGEYYGIADALDVLGKNCYTGGEITKKQWELITMRYPVDI